MARCRECGVIKSRWALQTTRESTTNQTSYRCAERMRTERRWRIKLAVASLLGKLPPAEA